MRMAELSAESGVPVATVKYYLREGLLPPGERTSPNQAHYEPGHVRRLRLIRAMLEVGGLSISQVRAVLDAMDAPEVDLHDVFGVAQRAVTAVPSGAGEQALAWARTRVADLVAERGWAVSLDSAPARALAGVLARVYEIAGRPPADQLSARAELAERVAELDVSSIEARDSVEDMVEGVVVGTVLGDAVFGALRRMAQVDASARRFATRAR